MIYFDNAATAPMSRKTVSVFTKALNIYGNPSSLHSIGRAAYDELEKARHKIAFYIGADPAQIVFTSGATEGNNFSIEMLRQYAYKCNKRAVLFSNVEHPSVFNAMRRLQDDSISAIAAPVPKNRTFKQDIDLQKQGVDYAGLSFMLVNNETGNIYPISTLAQTAHSHNAIVHTDATQAVGHIPVDVKALGVDFLTASGHKFGAPRGTGFIYIKDPEQYSPLIVGGKQEFGMRAGTENVAGAVAMAYALGESLSKAKDKRTNLARINKYCREELLKLPGAHLNTSAEDCVDTIISVRFDGVRADTLALYLDANGICVSTTSACHSSVKKPSHVLQAIGLTSTQALSTIRLSFSYRNTLDEVDKMCGIIDAFLRQKYD